MIGLRGRHAERLALDTVGQHNDAVARSTATLQIPEADPERYRLARELASAAPELAVAANVLCGTAGWTDVTLVKSGAFYPKKTMPARDRLEFYARHFSFVEVDATYYSLLPAENARNWLSWTPEAFVFDVKAHPVLTAHPIDVRRLPQDLRAACSAAGFESRVYATRLPVELRNELEARFREFLAPLLAAGRLGAVLLQFPQWFVKSRENVQHIERLAERWRDVPLAVEFRDRTWLGERTLAHTLELLQQNQLTYVCVDEPALKNSVPAFTTVTNPKLAIVRFHGHNREGWQKRGASVHERFNYLYAPDELKGWLEPVRTLARSAERVHATFNNCVRDYSVVNAKDLAALLTS